MEIGENNQFRVGVAARMACPFWFSEGLGSVEPVVFENESSSGRQTWRGHPCRASR